jgi:hypothetical protein
LLFRGFSVNCFLFLLIQRIFASCAFVLEDFDFRVVLEDESALLRLSQKDSTFGLGKIPDHRRIAWDVEGVEDGRRPPILRVDLMAVSEVARLQGVEGWGMAGAYNTLGSPWPVATPCHKPDS